MAVPFPRSRLLALVLGGALGDALGAPLEFEDTPQVEKRLREGLVPTSPELDTTRITDDTQTTLWVAEGLVRAHQRKLQQGVPSVEQAVRDALVRWYVTQEPGQEAHLRHASGGWLLGEQRLRGKRAPDNANLSAIQAMFHSPGWKRRPSVDESSDGPGALMRSSPYVVFQDVEACFEYASVGAALTHPRPEGRLPAAAFAALLHGLIRQQSVDEALTRTFTLLKGVDGGDALRRTLSASPSGTDFNISDNGGGWTATSALTSALVLAGHELSQAVPSIERCLWRAAAHGGKSDTVSALTGQLLGASLGPSSLPQAWLKNLKLRGVIERVTSDLYDAWVVGSEHELFTYPAG